MSSNYPDKALLMEQYKDWVDETPNPESLPLTDVLLLALLRATQAQEARMLTLVREMQMDRAAKSASAARTAPNHPY